MSSAQCSHVVDIVAVARQSRARKAWFYCHYVDKSDIIACEWIVCNVAGIQIRVDSIVVDRNCQSLFSSFVLFMLTSQQMCDNTGGNDAGDTCAAAPSPITLNTWYHVSAGMRDEFNSFQMGVHVYQAGNSPRTVVCSACCLHCVF